MGPIRCVALHDTELEPDLVQAVRVGQQGYLGPKPRSLTIHLLELRKDALDPFHHLTISGGSAATGAWLVGAEARTHWIGRGGVY